MTGANTHAILVEDGREVARMKVTNRKAHDAASAFGRGAVDANITSGIASNCSVASVVSACSCDARCTNSRPPIGATLV
jgi:hypothetical protein